MLLRITTAIAAVALAIGAGGPAQAGFDWSSDCGGDGEFSQPVRYYSTVTVGSIPAGKANVFIQLSSTTDVDVQLVDTTTGEEIIAWPYGLLSGADQGCAAHAGVTYCYSGYNGDQTAGGLGNEWIQVRGVTNRPLEMRAFGYQAGDANVVYSFEATSNTCNEVGSGEFSQYVPYQATTTVGEIPAGKVNVAIELDAGAGRDVDVQLWDGATALVQWPNGQLNGHSYQELEYQGMTITWSGYNGIDGNWGHERIEIKGRVSRTLTMKAFGYQSGTANVTYEWGVGAGATCMGIATLQCAEGLLCKAVQQNVSDPAGQCHTENWCESAETAHLDCSNLPHIMIPGIWTCEDFQCHYATQGPLPLCPPDESKTYVGNSLAQCQVIKFACEPFQSYFSDACGCGCQCPAVVDCEPTPDGPSCDIAAIKEVCPNTTTAL